MHLYICPCRSHGLPFWHKPEGDKHLNYIENHITTTIKMHDLSQIIFAVHLSVYILTSAGHKQCQRIRIKKKKKKQLMSQNFWNTVGFTVIYLSISGY